MLLVARHLTEEAWRRVGEQGLAETPRNRMMIALGSILKDASAEERAEFLSRVPVPARLLWRLVGRRHYSREMRRIREAY